MIQRIQSIWLFLAAITLVLMLFLPIVSKEIKTTEISIHTMGLYQDAVGKSGPGLMKEVFTPLLITNIVVALVCFINIFNFRRRSFQKRLAIISIILICGLAFWSSVYAKKIPGGLDGATYDIGAYLPSLAILFCVLAIFGINKDEKLIRSAERLR